MGHPDGPRPRSRLQVRSISADYTVLSNFVLRLSETTVLIYLDANIVQYCADHGDLVFSRKRTARGLDQELEIELLALADLIEVAVQAEQQDLDHRWDVAAPSHLMEELFHGRPTSEQREVYASLREAWRDLGLPEHGQPDTEEVNRAETALLDLNLRNPADRRHLAEAVALGASWFLTLDKDILKKTRKTPTEPGVIHAVTVGRPSELRSKVEVDPVFGVRIVDDRGLTSP